MSGDVKLENYDNFVSANKVNTEKGHRRATVLKRTTSSNVSHEVPSLCDTVMAMLLGRLLSRSLILCRY